MKQNQLDTIVQAGIAVVVIALLAWMLSIGEIGNATVITIITVLLAPFGFEIGRRVPHRREDD